MVHIPCLDNSSIKLVHEFLGLNHEVCGFIVPYKNKLQAIIDDKAKYNTSGYRKYCQLHKYQKYIWHTHPYSSKAYPSLEDIEKTIKHQIIRIQLIFTRWGIWEMAARNAHILDNKVRDNIDLINNELYFGTEKGRITSPSLRHIIDYNYSLNKILGKYGFKIRFTPWNEVQTPHYCLH